MERKQMMHFTILQEPVAKQRPRLGTWGVYDAQEKVKQKWECIFQQEMLLKGYKMLVADKLEVNMCFYIQIPKSLSKAKQSILENVFHARARPGDLDNCVKFVFDAMNDLVYNDDRQIVKMSAEKRYSANPRVEITVSVLEEK